MYRPIILSDAKHLGLRIRQNGLLIELEGSATISVMGFSGLTCFHKPTLPEKPYFFVTTQPRNMSLRGALSFAEAVSPCREIVSAGPRKNIGAGEQEPSLVANASHPAYFAVSPNSASIRRVFKRPDGGIFPSGLFVLRKFVDWHENLAVDLSPSAHALFDGF
jgi:hypothetical protein